MDATYFSPHERHALARVPDSGWEEKSSFGQKRTSEWRSKRQFNKILPWSWLATARIATKYITPFWLPRPARCA